VINYKLHNNKKTIIEFLWHTELLIGNFLEVFKGLENSENIESGKWMTKIFCLEITIGVTSSDDAKLLT
jgi:hypothetical protein